jgi:hypothetical protein
MTTFFGLIHVTNANTLKNFATVIHISIGINELSAAATLDSMK